MRTELKKINGTRTRFRGTVERTGSRPNYHGFPEPTVLLKNVVFVNTGKLATDHIWFTVGKTLERLALQPGDIVEFDARVGDYVKGYINQKEYIDEREIDYKLNRPTKIQKV
jgi:hypothetical protein